MARLKASLGEGQPLISRSHTMPSGSVDDRKYLERADNLRNLTLQSRSSLAMELPELHELIVSEDKDDSQPTPPDFLIIPPVKELIAPDESIWLVAPKWFRVARLWFQGIGKMFSALCMAM